MKKKKRETPRVYRTETNPEPGNPDDWSDPSTHPSMGAGVPILIFSVLLLLMVAYGFASG